METPGLTAVCSVPTCRLNVVDSGEEGGYPVLIALIQQRVHLIYYKKSRGEAVSYNLGEKHLAIHLI